MLLSVKLSKPKPGFINVLIALYPIMPNTVSSFKEPILIQIIYLLYPIFYTDHPTILFHCINQFISVHFTSMLLGVYLPAEKGRVSEQSLTEREQTWPAN